MAQKKLTASLVQINKIVTGNSKVVCTGAVGKNIFVDGKKSDTLESVQLSAISQELGEIQLIFPPHKELVEELNNQFPFGTVFSVSDVGEVADVKIGYYNNSLTFKFMIERTIEL